MSAYEVSMDHIGFLVNLGARLHVRGLDVGTRNVPLQLDDEHDRAHVAHELISQNQASIAHRYRNSVTRFVGSLRFAADSPPLKSVADIAQALQWVSCYRYQSCEDPDWPDSFAFHYCERLRSELESLIIARFDTSWTYDGPETHTVPTGCPQAVGSVVASADW